MDLKRQLNGMSAVTAVSPPTRGWTPSSSPVLLADNLMGFPAHAGMDPQGILSLTYPGRHLVSPPTRGWTRLAMPGALVSTTGFPAHAGMDPA